MERVFDLSDFSDLSELSSEPEPEPDATIQLKEASPKRAKKGKADQSKWKRNNRVKRAVTDIGPCACVGKCFKSPAFSAAKRLKIREGFQAMVRKEQHTYLSGLVDTVPP